MFFVRASIALWTLFLLNFISAYTPSGSRLLVVLEDDSLRHSYSQLLADFETRGHSVSIQSPKSDALSLFTHGARSYDHLVLFPPTSKGYGPNLTPQILVNFVNADGNILLLTTPDSTTEQARELARELDIELPPKGFKAVDHFTYDTADKQSRESHDLLLLSRPTLQNGLRNYFDGEQGDLIAFRGAGHATGNLPLLTPLLLAKSTAYTFDMKEEDAYAQEPWEAGRQMALISVFEARNNGRLVVASGADMFSNALFEAEVKPLGSKKSKTANRAFAKELTEWCFHEVGVLKVKDVRHWANSTGNGEMNPSIYRIKEDVSFEIDIAEYAHNRWVPFNVPEGDALQLEFTMLDPYYRVPLTPIPSSSEEFTTFTTSFRVPDQHGVFAFKVNYKRPFLTTVEEKYTVTVRHFAHDEYTRSYDIPGAWVWIAGVSVTVVGWMVFCALWLWSKPTEKLEKKTQ